MPSPFKNSKHYGTAREMTSRGISNGFVQSHRYREGEAVHYRGHATKPYPWHTRARNRRRNKIAAASRRKNRPV